MDGSWENNMIYLYVFLSGIFVACMQSFNGQLTSTIGMYGTSLVVHMIGGLVMLGYIKLVKRERIVWGPMPWYLYLGGLIGLVLVSFSSITISHIGNTLYTCFQTTGQVFLSIVLDHFGLFGIQQNSFNTKRIPGLLLILLGILIINFGG